MLYNVVLVSAKHQHESTTGWCAGKDGSIWPFRPCPRASGQSGRRSGQSRSVMCFPENVFTEGWNIL